MNRIFKDIIRYSKFFWVDGKFWVLPLLVFLLCDVLAVAFFLGFFLTKESISVALYGIFLFPLFMGGASFVVYYSIYKRLEKIRKDIVGEPINGALIVHGIIQSPGYVSLEGDTLVLTPLVGDALRLSLDSIEIVKSGSWFNGEWCPFQKGLWLNKDSVSSRIGFLPDNWPFWEACISQDQRGE